MKRIAIIIFLVFAVSFIPYKPVQAAAFEIDLTGTWDQYGMGEVEKGMDQLFPGYELDMKGVWKSIVQGKIIEAAGILWDGIKGKLVSELAGIKNVFASILILGIVSALFANFSDVFQNHQIADISFYFLYLLLISVLMKAFLAAADIAGQAVGNIVLFIQMFIPTYFIAVGAATGAVTGTVYYQFTLVLAYGVEKIIFSFLIPLIYSYVLLALMNGIWAEERLTLSAGFFKKRNRGGDESSDGSDYIAEPVSVDDCPRSGFPQGFGSKKGDWSDSGYWKSGGRSDRDGNRIGGID